MLCAQCQSTLPPAARFCPECGAPVHAREAEPDDPIRAALEANLGFQYRIERRLGRGGMGAVYLAHEFALDRDVAIKVLPPEQAITADVRDRFRREARTAARLSHPNIVPLHTFGEVAGLMYFVMGYVPGESLGGRLKRPPPLPPEDTRQIMSEIAGALEYAHRQGVVHRDIKPDNILIEEGSGRPVLTDFGIAKATVADKDLTMTGYVVGTPHYMSPEQAAGRPDLDGRSDIYSLGVVAYEALSGRLPFDAASGIESAMQRITKPPLPLRSVMQDVPDDLASAVTRCLATNRDDRWPDAKALKDALSPQEEDYEEHDTVVKAIRIGTFLVSISLLASGWMTLFGALNPASAAAKRMRGGLFGNSVMFGLMVLVPAILLRRRGLRVSEILRRALAQPRGWKGWYPRRWRRLGDVWDRLPRPLRQWRVYWTFFLPYMLLIYLPWSLGRLTLIRGSAYEGISLVITGLQFAMTVLFLLEFRRSLRWAKQTLTKGGDTKPGDESRAVRTASWRTTAWRRPPLQALLTPVAGARITAPNEPTIVVMNEGVPTEIGRGRP